MRFHLMTLVAYCVAPQRPYADFRRYRARQSSVAFAKGQSGNPKGGNLRSQALRAARTEIEKCITALAGLRDDERAPANLRLDAATRILAIGYPHFADCLASLRFVDQAMHKVVQLPTELAGG